MKNTLIIIIFGLFSFFSNGQEFYVTDFDNQDAGYEASVPLATLSSSIEGRLITIWDSEIGYQNQINSPNSFYGGAGDDFGYGTGLSNIDSLRNCIGIHWSNEHFGPNAIGVESNTVNNDLIIEFEERVILLNMPVLNSAYPGASLKMYLEDSLLLDLILENTGKNSLQNLGYAIAIDKIVFTFFGATVIDDFEFVTVPEMEMGVLYEEDLTLNWRYSGFPIPVNFYVNEYIFGSGGGFGQIGVTQDLYFEIGQSESYRVFTVKGVNNQGEEDYTNKILVFPASTNQPPMDLTSAAFELLRTNILGQSISSEYQGFRIR